jgi:hypothetical protein
MLRFLTTTNLLFISLTKELRSIYAVVLHRIRESRLIVAVVVVVVRQTVHKVQIFRLGQ